MIEMAVALMTFVVLVTLIFDAAWLLYHQIVITQSVKKAARIAGTNMRTTNQIRDAFFESAAITLVSSTDSSITNMTITTTQNDANYQGVDDSVGRPSVLVEVAHVHTLLAPINFVGTITLRASARSMINTWPDEPAVTF